MQLLVSPSSILEARSAVDADIIDVKKPSEGSLGANFPWVIKEIKSFAKKPVSAAIGDFPFQLFCKEALTAYFRQRDVEYLIALGDDVFECHCQTVIAAAQGGSHVFCLPQGKLAISCADDDFLFHNASSPLRYLV